MEIRKFEDRVSAKQRAELSRVKAKAIQCGLSTFETFFLQDSGWKIVSQFASANSREFHCSNR